MSMVSMHKENNKKTMNLKMDSFVAKKNTENLIKRTAFQYFLGGKYLFQKDLAL